MSTQNQYFPQSVPHPGIDLAEKLEELSMGPKEFAIRSNKPEKTIIAILSGKSSITPDMAVLFENVLQIPAHFWLNRQRSFDEFKAREERLEILKDSIDWAKRFPVKEMFEKNWISKSKSSEEITSSLLAFFGFSSHTAWENYYLNQQLKVAFRISLAQTKEPFALSAWLRKGEIQAAKLEANIYDEKKFKDSLHEIKSLMAKHPDNFFELLRDICLQVGVKVVYTPCLPKAPISGSTRWLNDDRPLIQLTGRYKRNDNFWFTFFHEAGHILIHGKKDIFLESIDYSEKDLEKEREADEFAVKWTFSKTEQEKVMNKRPLLVSDIIDFAKEFNTHPAMIIGRLQHDKLIPYTVGRQFMMPIEIPN